LNGREAVNIAVKKRSGENIIAISTQIDRLLEQQQVTWPAGNGNHQGAGQGQGYRHHGGGPGEQHPLRSGAGAGWSFFVMGLRNAILVSLAIPFSMLLTFTVLYVMGITLNMVVLFSLTLALGMLVDNAIVIVENIHRFMEQGAGRVEAAMRATSEVAYPVIGSTSHHLGGLYAHALLAGDHGRIHELPAAHPDHHPHLQSVCRPGDQSGPGLAVYEGKGARRCVDRKAPDAALTVEKPVVTDTFWLKRYSGLLRFSLERPLVIVTAAFCRAGAHGTGLAAGDRPGKTGGVFP
jgi:multidrug efflux pump